MEAAGGAMDDIVRVTIYLIDIADREAVWKARREFFTGDFPVSTLIEVSRLARPEMRVEIEAVAILGADGRSRRSAVPERRGLQIGRASGRGEVCQDV